MLGDETAIKENSAHNVTENMLDVKLILNACDNNMNNDNRPELAECCTRYCDCDDASVAIEDTHTTNFPLTDLNEAPNCLSIHKNEFVENRSGKCSREEENVSNVGYGVVRIIDGNNIILQPFILSEDDRKQRQSQQRRIILHFPSGGGDTRKGRCGG